MVRIGKEPILYHLIKNFYNQGLKNFVLCLGYRSESITKYFFKEKKKFTKLIKLTNKTKRIFFYDRKIKVNIDLIDTGINSGTGGRIKTAYKMLNLNEDILMTYGDGLSSLPIKKLIKFHYLNNSLVTISAVRPKQRYGILKIRKNKVNFFDNSNKKIDIYINGGFHVIAKNAVKKIKNKKIFWEKEPLNYFMNKKKLFAFKYDGFWKSLDTLKDKNDFNKMYFSNKRYWEIKK